MARKLCGQLVGAALACACMSGPLFAQSVRGQVIDSLSGNPVPRGFIVLVDREGNEVTRTLTSPDGTYSLKIAAAGEYHIRSERIGYAVVESEFFSVNTGEELVITLQVRALATRLVAVKIRGETMCGDPAEDEEFGALWIEARKALAAASWTNKQAYTHSLHRYRRVRDARRRTVTQERSWRVEGYAIQPFASITAERLALHGFVVKSGEGRYYYGPDANVLLHDSFHQTHCFKAVRGDGELAGLVGLAFEPAPNRERPDIDGVLWIDPESSELRRIEYRYTEIDLPIRDDRIGGTITFTPLSSGAWILDTWQIRAPILEYRRQIDSFGRVRSVKTLTGIGEIGGNVIAVADREGAFVYTSPDISYVSGTVHDSAGIPLAGEFVRIAGTGYTTHTDSNGDFVFKSLLHGLYAFTTATLDSLGYSAGRVEHYILPRDTSSISLSMPRLQTAQHHLCPAKGIPESQGALVAVVQDTATNEPLVGVEVTTSWRPAYEPEAKPLGTRRTRTDSTGSYVFCELPVHRRIRVEIKSNEYSTPPRELTFGETWVVMGDDAQRRGEASPYRIWKVDLLAVRR